MVELEKKDWESARKSAETMIKQALVDLEVGNNLLKTTEENLKKFPEEDDKD